MELIDTGRIQLGVDRRGEGPPVILVGGTGMPPIAWDVAGMTAALADGGFDVIAYASRGVAPSDAPSAHCTIADLAEDLTSLIDILDLDRPPALVGYSLGSFTIEHLLSTSPHQFSAGVLIAGPGPTTSLLHSVVNCEAALIDRLGTLPTEVMTMQTLLTALPPTALATADPLVDQWATMSAYQSAQWTSSDGEVAQARASHAWLRDEGRMDRLQHIDVPVLAVAFEFDPLVGPTQAQSAVDQIPGAELCVIPDAGHGGVMTHAQHVVPRVVEFLNKHHS
ncbi:alpha/beta fold hydrolase [Rhodococcus sp. UNC363MFTsu5.1]|uniref:alpha/beta fold hydrolase n=1 Tax=Rhodococcus sp. UNC363MFTsu5.1 TaxID=1449069 RepID=UPI000689D893|nr:alpha/beta hydrolase [Rhodococcus sp. UNC363MFTsu5.1]